VTEGRNGVAIRYGRIVAALLVCFAGGALASIAVATSTDSDFAAAAYYYYCPGGGAGSNYGYCPPTTTEPDRPTVLTLAPAADTNPVGTSHTVTATVLDQDGDPMAGVVVRFRVTGSTTASGSCTTNAAGMCDFTYTGPAFPGADLISAFADDDEDNTRDPDEPMGEAMKAWVLPASTPGQVTGGGQILDANGNRIAFGFNTKSDGDSFKGECTVVDRIADRMIKCKDVTAVVQSGNQAEIHGSGTDNGVQMSYVIRVTDNAESGKGTDTFSIQTSSGYSAGGTLVAGNIQVHG
jgi:hypothetical protein